MNLTIVQAGLVPDPLKSHFEDYPAMFRAMFDSTGPGFSCSAVDGMSPEPLPDPATLEGIVITGSPAGVYDDLPWIEPLRAFIRRAYAIGTPMLGICFGHQVMADALGGDVRKSEKGWGLGRHDYHVVGRPSFMADAPDRMAIACSHQDQVIVAPPQAEVILASPFTPNAGLLYASGKALSFQPHPEFSEEFAQALTEMRRGVIDDAVVAAAMASYDKPSDSQLMRNHIAGFFRAAAGAA